VAEAAAVARGALAELVDEAAVCEDAVHLPVGRDPITTDLYSHVMPSALREAAAAMDRALGADQ
jgi:hypothetical protein